MLVCLCLLGIRVTSLFVTRFFFFSIIVIMSLLSITSFVRSSVLKCSRSFLLFISPELACDASCVPGNLWFFLSSFSLVTFLGVLFLLYVFYFAYSSWYAKRLGSAVLFDMRTVLSVLATYLSIALPFSENLVEFIYCFIALNVSIYALMLCGSRASVYAALCYFILGSVATAFLFVSLGVWVSVFGSVSFSSVAVFFYNQALSGAYGFYAPMGSAVAAASLIFIPLLFKLGVFPFQFYLPLVYASVGRQALFVITVPVKLGVVCSMFGFVELFFPIIRDLQLFFWVVGLASILVGAFSALAETGWRRFWSYSYMNNVGTALLGLSFCGEVVNVSAAAYYLVVYIVQWVLVWLLGCFVFRWVDACVGYSHTFEIRYISQLAALGRVYFCRMSLYPILVSMAGIPPMLAFWMKFGIFANLVSQGTSISFFVLLVSLLVVPLNAFNYMRLVRLIAFGQNPAGTAVWAQRDAVRLGVELTTQCYAIVAFVAFVNVLMFTIPVAIFVATHI